MKNDKPLKLLFNNVNVPKFINFLDRFKVFDDNNLLLEITEDEMRAKTYTADHTSVKCSAIPFEEVFQVKEKDLPELLKIGMLNISQYKKSMKYLESSDQVSFMVNYYKMAGIDTDFEYVSHDNIITDNKNLSFTFKNGSMATFRYISDDYFYNDIAKVEPIFSFNLDVEDLLKINKYADIDKDDTTIKIKCKNEEVIISNHNFKFKLPGKADLSEDIEDETSARISKVHLKMIDSESYTVLVGETKIVLNSTDSKTSLVLGRNDSI